MTNQGYFFGYGSLVNRATHHFDARPATLRGWRRIWRHTAIRPVAYLTVVPDPDCQIEGLMAPVPNQDWAALDERERAYDRVDAREHIAHDLDHEPEIVVYSIPEGKHAAPSQNRPVLLSYIDVVVQGYLREFDEQAVAAFFNTTSGWDAPVLNDRAAPLYPRHQSLKAWETALVDDHLSRLGVRLIKELPTP